MSIGVLKRINASSTARWAKHKGTSKLNFVLVYGVLFGLFVAVLSRAALYMLDVYWFNEVAPSIDNAGAIGGLIGGTLAGFYIAALAWEQIESVDEKE